MKLIVSHITPDFDALASMALAQVLHPDAKIVRLGSLSPQIESVSQLYADLVWLYSIQDFNLNEVSELIVVDTSEKNRIAPFDSLIDKVPITLYDHHQQSQDSIPALHGIHQKIGATASILTLLLEQKGIQISKPLASLALLGIYDDTGSLSYNTTTAKDCEAVAHLLKAGASLQMVRDYVNIDYTEEHRKLFSTMLQHAQQINIVDHVIVIAEFNSQNFIYDLAPLCNMLLEFYNAEAAFIIADMDDNRFIIARSGNAFNVAVFLRSHFLGGGHASAASAKTDLASKIVIDKIKLHLADYSQTTLTAIDIMSSPVNSISVNDTITEAQQMILRYGHNGLPVINTEKKLVGFISRRMIDKAIGHKLTHVAVEAYMTKGAVTALTTTTLDELEKMIQTHNIGRIPIVEKELLEGKDKNSDNMIGIVSRSDVMKALYQLNGETQNPSKVDTILQASIVKKIEHLPQIIRVFLATALKALPEKANLYIVGGSARDLLANLPMKDLDLMVEGITANELAKAISQVSEATIEGKDDFATCTIIMPNSLSVDIATARQEFYGAPGVLPEVAPSNIDNDLQRRDYSINAMAIRLNEPVELIDPFGGLDDLENKSLNLLHPLSLIDDPTRVFRGARLAGRLGLLFAKESQVLIGEMLQHEVRQTITSMRLRNELELILSEDSVLPALKILEDTQVLQTFFHTTVNHNLIANLDLLKQKEIVSSESYLLALFLNVKEEEINSLLERYSWKQDYLKSLNRLRKIIDRLDVSLKEYQSLNEAEKSLLKTYSPELAATLYGFESQDGRPLLNGSDLVRLGIEQGPKVGEVLEILAQAKQAGQVQSYEDEITLVKKLIEIE